MFSPKQVGERIKERRTELKLSMPELGKRIGVNKSTIQRYEADGVDPKRTMIINGLAEALLTTPEWLTGLSDDKEYSIYTVCQMDLEKHIKGLSGNGDLYRQRRAAPAAVDHISRPDRRPLHHPRKVLGGVHEEGR
jgi:Predicted transcriptional regulators